ncbi:MAG: diguanylate cyclase [Gammaproteobacteria bacterium]|nr:MAG: diguanylate cyclase [Gammaproteobacteria bacterium]
MSVTSETPSAYGVIADTSIPLHTRDGEGKAKSHPCILLVENSPTTLRLLSKPLSQRYSLLSANDGLDAWNLLQTRPEIELVITDIVMPHLSGHELLVKIRASDDAQIRNLPVIVIAGAVDKDARDLAFRDGANDFVTKPIDATELQARVHVHHKLARTIHELEISRHQLTEQATTDPLTQLKNRRAFFQEGRQGLALSQRSGNHLSVMLLDIDHFKRVNDTYGHQAGDRVLTALAELLGEMGRTVDTVARVGGEEFAIVLPDTSLAGAAVLAERIRTAVEHSAFDTGAQPVSLTVSVGVATFGADPVDSPADSIDALLKVADRRLYIAKKEGRNRICTSDQGDTTTWP